MGAGVPHTDYLAIATFRYELRRFQAFSEGFARKTGLEPPPQHVLLAINGLPAGQTATIGTFAARLQLRHHNVVELIDRHVTKGLIARTRDRVDRRHVVITPERWPMNWITRHARFRASFPDTSPESF